MRQSKQSTGRHSTTFAKISEEKPEDNQPGSTINKCLVFFTDLIIGETLKGLRTRVSITSGEIFCLFNSEACLARESNGLMIQLSNLRHFLIFLVSVFLNPSQ